MDDENQLHKVVPSTIGDFKKPINLFFIISWFISTLLAVIFYFKTIKEAKPTFIISPDHSIIFNSKASTPNIVVLDKASKLVKDNIYLCTIQLWNYGNLPIEPKDVRRPVQLVLSPCSKILDIRIIYSTNEDVSQFRLIESNDAESGSKAVKVNWKHFDPKQGFKFQVLYSGVKKADLHFVGMISGVERFVDGRSLVDKYIDNDAYSRIAALIYVIFIFGMSYLSTSLLAENVLKISINIPKKLSVTNEHLRHLLIWPLFFIILLVPIAFIFYIFYFHLFPRALLP